MTEKNLDRRNARSVTDGLNSREAPDLQAELDQMARETPDVPESFRQSWRAAVRQEAAKSAPKARRGLSWRRGLSVAAVFAFLLGGALLSQDSVSLIRKDSMSGLPAETASPAAPMPTGLPSFPPEADFETVSGSQAAEDSFLSMAARKSEEDSGAADSIRESASVSASGLSADTESDTASGTAFEADFAVPAESLSDFFADSEESFEAESAMISESAPEAETVPEEPLSFADSEESLEAESIPKEPLSPEVNAAGRTAADDADFPSPGSAGGEIASAQSPDEPAEEKAASGFPKAADESDPPGPLRTAGIILICLSFLMAALLLALRNRKP